MRFFLDSKLATLEGEIMEEEEEEEEVERKEDGGFNGNEEEWEGYESVEAVAVSRDF